MSKPLKFRCLITAGPTREHIDPVRFLSNGSSGKMGFALAASAIRRGWHVDLVSGPVSLSAPEEATLHRIISAQQMLSTCETLFLHCDMLLMVAAVSDYRPAEQQNRKSAKIKGPYSLQLVPNPDILKTLSAQRRPGQTLVGFAAQTHDLETYAREKLASKGCDWIVANDVSQSGIGMEADANAVTLFSAKGVQQSFGPAPKRAVADFILEAVAPRKST